MVCPYKALLISLTFGWIFPAELPEPLTFADAEDRRLHRTTRLDSYAERDLRFRQINHAQRVFEHVQRARHSAPGTSAE